MASNVPKFTSFRPKPKEPAEQPKESSKQTDPKKPERPEKSSKEEAQEKNETRRGDGHRSHAHEVEPPKVYFRDRRGDPDIVRYGSFNKYDVPAYRRYGYGNILGLPRDRKIDRDRSTDKGFIPTPSKHYRQERLLTDKHAARERSRAIRFLKAVGDDQAKDLDFISLSTKGKRKREHDDEDLDADYRGFEQPSSAGKPPDPDAEYESETQVSSADAAVTQRNSALVRRTHEHPEDLHAWLDLIDHQEAMMKIDRSSELSSSDKQHLADVRISTYEQALRKMGDDEESQIKLYTGLMTEASKSWDIGRLKRKWFEILAKFPRSVDLWMQYLESVQSNFTSFKYESCRASYFECLKALRLGPTPVDVNVLLYILVRLTRMIQQAGYQELALAVWQALLEFHLLNANLATTNVSQNEELHLFEEFWESEVPRVGEAGAKGWKDFTVSDAVPPPSGPPPLVVSDSNSLPFEDFYRREVDCSVKLRYPGRTTDEVGDDDPFHTILFTDIEAFLQIVPRGTSATLLVDAFLRFCQLPPLRRAEPDQQSTCWHDPLLLSAFSRQLRSNEANSFAQILGNYAACPLSESRLTLEVLFERAFPEIDIVDTAFVRRTLKLLAGELTNDESLGEYLLAFESKFFPSEAFKTAKQLLKGQPTSLRLYNAYGLVESRRGNSAKADQVFSAALSMQKGATPFSTPASLELFSSWVWEALCRGNRNEALWRLVSPKGHTSKPSALHDEIPDQVALLRARASLQDAHERALLGDDHPTAVISISLLAMLAYLSGGEKPSDALAVHNRLANWLAERKLATGPTAELHAQAVARFLAYHATHASIVKPSLLRTTLEQLIANFPNNTILLSIYAANEARFSIDDRVRGIVHQKVLSNAKDRTIVGWTFAIHYEMLRGEIAGSTSASIRALFKKAEEDAGAHCPALWKQHLLFEMEEAKKERAKRPVKKSRRDGKKRKEDARVEGAYRRATETFFDGITHLPWCKDFIMMAFTHLGDEFLSQEDLRKVYNVMVEKELRLYVEVDESAT